VVVKNTEIILKDNYAIFSTIETTTVFYWAKIFRECAVYRFR